MFALAGYWLCIRSYRSTSELSPTNRGALGLSTLGRGCIRVIWHLIQQYVGRYAQPFEVIIILLARHCGVPW